MTEYTLLKLQVGDASFIAHAHAPFSGGRDESSGESAGETERESADGDSHGADGDSHGADGRGSSRRLLPLVFGLAFLVVVAVVVRKLRGSGGP